MYNLRFKYASMAVAVVTVALLLLGGVGCESQPRAATRLGDSAKGLSAQEIAARQKRLERAKRKRQERQARAKREIQRMASELELSKQAATAAWEALERQRPIHVALKHALTKNTARQADLGKQLFFDPRLSSDGQTACQSCHQLKRYGVDGQAFPTGSRGVVGKRNTPTVLNVGGLGSFFWDGRATSLEEQAQGPLLSKLEMGLSNEQEAVAILAAIPGYPEAFDQAFPGETPSLNFKNITRALAAFERRLLTEAAWDRYLAGQADAISRDARRGFGLLFEHGCSACHTGTLFGGGSIEHLGAKEPWPNQVDQGRFEAFKRPMDRMRFRVAPLRNVEKTAPYFHDASASTLDAAVRKMAKHQSGKLLTQRDVDNIVAFLRSLTGELPRELIKAPRLPAQSQSSH